MSVEFHFSNVPDHVAKEAQETFNDFLASFDIVFNATGAITITPQLEGEDES
jgi:hypothetical protein